MIAAERRALVAKLADAGLVHAGDSRARMKPAPVMFSRLAAARSVVAHALPFPAKGSAAAGRPFGPGLHECTRAGVHNADMGGSPCGVVESPGQVVYRGLPVRIEGVLAGRGTKG